MLSDFILIAGRPLKSSPPSSKLILKWTVTLSLETLPHEFKNTTSMEISNSISGTIVKGCFTSPSGLWSLNLYIKGISSWKFWSMICKGLRFLQVWHSLNGLTNIISWLEKRYTALHQLVSSANKGCEVFASSEIVKFTGKYKRQPLFSHLSPWSAEQQEETPSRIFLECFPFILLKVRIGL